MKYSNVFVIAVLVSIAAAGLVCFADDAEATPSNSGEAFVEDASTLLKETIGDDIAKVHYLEGGVIEIVADPSYITLLSANTTELKEKAYNTFIQYDAFYLDGTYFVKDHVPDVPTGTAKALAIAGQAFYKLCNSEPGTIAVYESTEFSITKRGYEPFEGQIVVKVVANQKDIDFANYVSTMVGIDPEKGDIYVSIMVRNLEDRTSVRDALGWLASQTATEFFGPTYAGYVNAICDKLSRVPNAINSASFVWEVDGEKFIISVDGFKPGEGEDPFQKLARGLYDSIADPIPGYSNGWDEPISTFKNDITGDYVASGEALADYHVGNGTVVTLRANVDTTVGPLYKNSGQAFVEDMNRFF